MSDAKASEAASAKPALFSRLATAVVYAVTGRAPDWFGPNEPIAPQAPPGIGGRQTNIQPGTNLGTRVRADEEISVEQLRMLAENCDVMKLVIQTRKDQLSGLDWQFQLRDAKAGSADDPRLAMLNAFFKSPDREHSWDQWLGALVDDLLIIDAATVFPRKTLGGSPYGFEFVDGGTIKRVIDDFGRTPLPPAPAYQQILMGLPAVNYTREELIYLPRNLRTHKLYGMSPVQQVVMTVNIALRRAMHQLEYYTAGTVPDAVAGVPENWSPDMIGDFQRYWDELQTDNQAERRRMRFVPGAIAKSLHQTKEAALKDEFDEWLARIVCYAFSVSNQWAVKQMNRSTSETAQSMAAMEGLGPLKKWVKALVERCVLVGWGWNDIELAWKEQQETNPKDQMEVAVGYLKVGVLTRNQVLADMGHEPVEGGDIALIYTAAGAVRVDDVLMPPKPVPSQLGHNGGPPLVDGADPAQVDPSEADPLEKAASPEARLAAIWSHFLKHEAPKVAQALADALGDTLGTKLQKAAGDEEEAEDPLFPRLFRTGAPPVRAVASDAAAAEAAAAIAAQQAVAPPAVTEAVAKAVRAMPWPAVQASAAAVLEDAALAGVKDGMGSVASLAGISVKDATRLANPNAIVAAQLQAAELVRGVDDTTRVALNRLVVQAQTEGWSTKQLITRLVTDHAFSEERALLIARTELKRSASQGQVDSWRATSKLTGLKMTKRVILGLNENHCVACRSAVMEGAIPIEESWSVGFAPPFHPACYCNMVPGVAKA